MDKRILEYIIKVLFKDWGAFEGLVGIFVGSIAFLMPDTLLPDKIKILVAGFLVLFFIKISKQFYRYFMDFNHPIKVVRKVQGDGSYSGIDIIVMNSQDNIESGMLMTLFSSSSGAEQPICILEVLSSVNRKEIIAKQLFPDPNTRYSIDKYFEEESRKKSLYAKTVVNIKIINSFQNLN